MVDWTRFRTSAWLSIVFVLILVVSEVTSQRPPRPTNLAVTAVTDTTITLSWSITFDFDPNRSAQFTLRYKGAIRGDWTTAGVVSSSTRSFIFSDFNYKDSFGYVFKVIAAYVDTGEKASEETETGTLLGKPLVTPSSAPSLNLTCRPYNGSNCSGLLTHSLLYVADDGRSETEKEKLAAIVLDILDGACGGAADRLAAKRMACDMIFQPCHPRLLHNKNIAVARPVCRGDCRRIAGSTCGAGGSGGGAWANVSQFIGIECDKLPPANGGAVPECLRYGTVDAHDGVDFKNSTDCYFGNGQGYEGTEDLVETGTTCAPWHSENLADQKQLFLGYNATVLKSWSNFCRNPQGRGEKPWCYTQTDYSSWEYCSIPKCVGKVECKQYDVNWKDGDITSVCERTPGFRDYSVSVDPTQSQLSIFDVNSQITKLVVNNLDFKTEDCSLKNHAIDLLCYETLPFCVKNKAAGGETTTYRLCQDTCERWASVDCRGRQVRDVLDRYFVPGKNEALLGERDITNLILTHNCSSLPKKNAGEGPECVDFEPPPPDLGGEIIPTPTSNVSGLEEIECYRDEKGVNYRGNLSVAGNYTCAPWNSSTPHFHPFVTPSQYPNLIQNYCRNPGSRGERPWCYTTDPRVRWKYCDVPRCVAPPTQQSTNGIASSYVPVIAAVVGGITGVIIICLIIFCEMKKRQRKVMRQTSVPIRLLSLSRARSNSSAMENNPLYMEKISCPEIAKDQVAYISDLGEGNFGKVFKGQVRGLISDEETTIVAVKTLKADSDDQTRRDFYREALLMSNFNHPNIIRLMGVSLDSSGPLYLLFEFMELGDLNKYLVSNAGNYHRKSYYYNSVGRSHSQSSTLSDTLTQKPSLSIEQLIQIATQIAAGMNYLSHRRYVHRDLATRNCLVATNLIVKIADFGMSQDIYSMDYYRVGGAALLPVRWMPPEAIIYGKSTVYSDVWSFGVVLWEIFSFAMQPYYGLSNEEVVDAVRKGRQLNRPEDCPMQIYELMKACWNMEPEERPSFKKLYRQLSDWNPALMSGSLANPSMSLTTCGDRSSSSDPDDVFDGTDGSLTVELPPLAEGTETCNGKVPREGKNGVNGHTKVQETTAV